MKLLNPNTPLSNFITTILNEKNKQIKENILLGDIYFPKILFYSKRKEENALKSPSHISFLKNLNRQRQLSEIREEKSNLEKKVNMVDNQLLNIKNLNSFQNKINYNEKYLKTNLNNIKTKSKNNSKSSKKSSKSKNKNTSVSSEKKNTNISSLPTLGKERKKNKKLQNIGLKILEIKPFKSNSKVHNHETEQRLEKDAKAFIQKINKRKKNLLAMINKKHEKFSLKLKKEIEIMERQKKLKLDEYNNNNLYNNGNYYYQNNMKNYSNLNNLKKEENKYSPDNSPVKNYKKKKYYHYSPYSIRNPKMLKNLSKDLLNFNSELYYNNNIPDIIQYQHILAPFYMNNNMMNKVVSTPLINIDDNDNFRNNNQDIIDMTNGEVGGNISGYNNYSIRNDESNMDSNMIDNSFNKKHLYYFNEPKYEIELTSGEIDVEQTKQNNNFN